MNETDKSVKIFRPALQSVWFLFFGLAVGPAIMFFERDPEGHPAKWIGLSLACLALILHRLSLKYTLTEREVRAEAWWGLGRPETVSLASLRRVRSSQGVAGRLVGCGHLEVESEAFDEPGLSLLGQPNHLALADQIERLAARVKTGRLDGG